MTEPTKDTPKPRKIQLTKATRQEFIEQKNIELAVSFFLDLEQSRTLKQIADEMNMSVSGLKRLTQDPRFQEVYDQTIMQLGHHPRLQALNTQLPELIPDAYRALKRLLSAGTAHTAQVAAVKLLFDTLQVGNQLAEEDPAALNNFLASKGINIQQQNVFINTNLPIPAEYTAAFKKFMGSEVVDVKAEDVPQLSPTSETDEEKTALD